MAQIENVVNYTINRNEARQGLEITFSGKPSAAVRDALKDLCFRWHSVKHFWYGRADEETIRAAIDGAQGTTAPASVTTASKPGKASPAVIDLSGLDQNHKTTYGADFAKTLREDLKRRGAKGYTIRAARSGYTDHITVTISLSADDLRSAEEVAARSGWGPFFRAEEWGITVDGINYWAGNEGRETDTKKYLSCGSAWDDNSDSSNAGTLRSFYRDRLARFDSLNQYHRRAADVPELTAAAFNRVSAIVDIIQSYNWDNSDSMTDYYDVGFYLDINFKIPADYQPRETMTDAERVQLYKDIAAEKEAERERLEAFEREQEQRRKEAEEHAEQERRDVAEVLEAVTVEDLTDEQSYYINGLSAGIGKECNTAEILENLTETDHTAHITRRVTFSTAEALEKFKKMLLCDWPFLSGKGGTGTNDPRVNNENIMKLNREQRAAVRFFSVDCVAVYFSGKLALVSNPEGCDYSRYTYLPNDGTTESTPAESAERDEEEQAAAVEPFYFPAPVEEQAKRLTVGDVVTVYQTDGTILNILKAYTGILTDVKPGTWAQHSGAWLTIQNGRKAGHVFCSFSRNNTAVFQGLPLELPESVTFCNIKNTGTGATLREYRNSRDQLREAINYYKAFDRVPVLDTLQR